MVCCFNLQGFGLKWSKNLQKHHKIYINIKKNPSNDLISPATLLHPLEEFGDRLDLGSPKGPGPNGGIILQRPHGDTGKHVHFWRERCWKNDMRSPNIPNFRFSEYNSKSPKVRIWVENRLAFVAWSPKESMAVFHLRLQAVNQHQWMRVQSFTLRLKGHFGNSKKQINIYWICLEWVEKI